MIGLLAMALAVLCMFARGESIIKTNGLHSGIQTRDVLDWRENQSLVQKRQAQIPPRATWGPFLSLGQTKSEYVHLQMTYVAGAPPANMKGDLFLWGGLFDQTNRGNGDLIQTVTEGHPAEGMQRTCNASPGQWCIRPFVVHGCCLSQTPPFGKVISPKDQILIEYTKDPGPGGMWTQTLWSLGYRKQKLFEYAKGNAPTKWFQIATESQGGNTGTTDSQNYYNITLRLRTPDPGLGAKFRTTGKIEADRPVTTDGGQTWTIKHVMIPAMVNGKALVPT